MITRVPFRGATKKAIAADWRALFPALSFDASEAGNPTWVRIVGPLVQGIVLERSSDVTVYRPASFVHFLGLEFPGISLTLRTPPRKANGAELDVSVHRHAERHREIARLLAEQSPLPLDRVPTLAEVLAAYCRRIELERHPDWPGLAAGMVPDLILIPATLGRPDLVEEALAYARQISPGWLTARNALGQLMLPQGERWLEELARTAADRAALRDTVEREIVRHKLEGAPRAELA